MTYNYKVSPCSRLEIRNFADYFRKKTKLYDELAYPIVKIFELLAEAGYYNYEVISIEDMPDKVIKMNMKPKCWDLEKKIWIFLQNTWYYFLLLMGTPLKKKIYLMSFLY